MEMTTYEFEGWVYGIVRSKWGVEIKVSSAKDDKTVPYPQHILFATTKKSIAKVPSDLREGDKVKVVFAPFLSEGVSRAQRVYAINKNMLIDIAVTERGEPKREDDEDLGDEGEFPF